ncbi:hypothetical protein EV126DRAFT_54209 [Verticillium dahliae]|nr:hypothetical protein EV126DRAFT_54209 [Verticillium dahliae]
MPATVRTVPYVVPGIVSFFIHHHFFLSLFFLSTRLGCFIPSVSFVCPSFVRLFDGPALRTLANSPPCPTPAYFLRYFPKVLGPSTFAFRLTTTDKSGHHQALGALSLDLQYIGWFRTGFSDRTVLVTGCWALYREKEERRARTRSFATTAFTNQFSSYLVPWPTTLTRPQTTWQARPNSTLLAAPATRHQRPQTATSTLFTTQPPVAALPNTTHHGCASISDVRNRNRLLHLCQFSHNRHRQVYLGLASPNSHSFLAPLRHRLPESAAYSLGAATREFRGWLFSTACTI